MAGARSRVVDPRCTATDLEGERATPTPEEGATVTVSVATITRRPAGTVVDDEGTGPWSRCARSNSARQR